MMKFNVICIYVSRIRSIGLKPKISKPLKIRVQKLAPQMLLYFCFLNLIWTSERI